MISASTVFATRLAENGVSAATIAKLLGHTSPAFTMNRYIHSVTEEQLRAINILSTNRSYIKTADPGNKKRRST